MQLPKVVRIAGHPVKVSTGPLKHMGEYTHREGKIKIADDLSTSQGAATLLHEILHSCYRTAYLGPKDAEETIVRNLEVLLYQVIRDNPKLIKFIQEAK